MHSGKRTLFIISSILLSVNLSKQEKRKATNVHHNTVHLRKIRHSTVHHTYSHEQQKERAKPAPAWLLLAALASFSMDRKCWFVTGLENDLATKKGKWTGTTNMTSDE